MTNNERFNAMLNRCSHPRAVHNALQAMAPLIRETRSTFPESFVGKTDREIISKISAVNRRTGAKVEAQNGN